MKPITSLGGSGSGQVGRYGIRYAFSRLANPGCMGGSSITSFSRAFIIFSPVGFWEFEFLLLEFWLDEVGLMWVPVVTRAYLGLMSFLATEAGTGAGAA